jgi:hypothetical protein
MHAKAVTRHIPVYLGLCVYGHDTWVDSLQHNQCEAMLQDGVEGLRNCGSMWLHHVHMAYSRRKVTCSIIVLAKGNADLWAPHE